MSGFAQVVAASAMLAAGAAWGLDDKPTGIVFPSGETVPENLLRIELRFSTPLRIPLSIDNVKLIGGDGREIEDAFLDLPLSSADGRRVTVLLDPGRVKSGLAENLSLGRALRSGSVVTLEVNDRQLAHPILKTWRVTDFNSDSPRPDLWTFRRPRCGTKDSLDVQLGSPVSSTAENSIAIRAPDARRVPGTAHLDPGETVWRFVPAIPWHPGIYGLVTRPELEDAAGNRPCGPFEAIAASRIPCDVESVHNFKPRGRADLRSATHK